MPTSTYEAAGRARKITRIIAVLDKIGAGVDELDELGTPEWWANVARAAQVRPPSPATIAGIRKVLEERAALADDDVFEGLV